MATLSRTALHDWHAAHGARLVDFAGWSMPVQYSSIVEEHRATRTAAGLFDVSHMGRLRFVGPSAPEWLDGWLTRRVRDMAVGKVRYSVVTNESGGILDDVLLTRLEDTPAGPSFLLVVNASNRDKIVGWVRRLGVPADVTMTDETLVTAMIAVQGPRALALVQPLVGTDLASLRYYHAASADVLGAAGIVSRTGYTGEDGCELIVPADRAVAVWERLMTSGAELGVAAVGLGARDTLRLEAAMPLYGHELSEQIDPLTAGLDFAVNLEGRQFVGRDALAAIRSGTLQQRRVGLVLAGKRVPREHYPVLSGGETGPVTNGTVTIGTVTSGTFSPTLDRPLAMAYVRPEFAVIGTRVAVDIRGRGEPAEVVKLPFYVRPR